MKRWVFWTVIGVISLYTVVGFAIIIWGLANAQPGPELCS